MNYQEKLIRSIAKKYNLDWRVVRESVYYPIKFANRVIKSPTDLRPVRIMYFGAFTQKLGKKNKVNRMEGKANTLLENIDEVSIVMINVLQFIIKSADGAKKIINNAVETKDIEKIDMIWDAWQETKK